MKQQSKIHILACLIFLATLSPLIADQVELKNGDHLSGTCIETHPDYLIFDNQILGSLTIPTENIHSLKITNSISDKAPASEKEQIYPLQKPNLSFEEESLSFIYKAISTIIPFKDWNPKLNFGYTWQSSDTIEKDWIIKFKAHDKEEDFEIMTYASFSYGITEEKDTYDSSGNVIPGETIKDDDAYNLGFTYRINFRKYFFLQTNSDYQKDRILQIRHEIEQNIGLGWRFIDNKRWQGTITPSLTARYKESYSDRNGNLEGLYTLFQELSYKHSENLSFSQDARISAKGSNMTKSYYQFNISIENKMAEKLSLEIGYDYTFDYTLDVGIEGKETLIYTTLGYQF